MGVDSSEGLLAASLLLLPELSLLSLLGSPSCVKVESNDSLELIFF